MNLFVVEGGGIYEYIIVYGVGESLRNNIANINAIARTLKAHHFTYFTRPLWGKIISNWENRLRLISAIKLLF